MPSGFDGQVNALYPRRADRLVVGRTALSGVCRCVECVLLVQVVLFDALKDVQSPTEGRGLDITSAKQGNTLR